MSSLVTSTSDRGEEEHGQAGLKCHAEFHRDVLSLIPSLRTYARALTRNQSDIDDLVQDTLVKAISHIHQFTPGTNLRAC